jgi:hypothetical protein
MSMTIPQAIMKFHWCCRVVTRNNNVKALDYCMGYAQAGLNMNDPAEIHAQALYMLSNMSYWRGEMAKTVKSSLKEITAKFSNY